MLPRRQTILIVEGDMQQRRLLSLALRTAGFDTREARDGMEALTLLDLTQFDGVVLDVVLRGLDGFAVREEILANARTRQMPIIVVTASNHPFLERLDAGCVLRKPVAPEQVVAAVRRCL